MLISKIQLINITSHVDTTIEFTEGLNILMGSNGTGKSSVLTMIGYVLFNHLPGTKKIYIRHGGKQKFGTIRVWIKAHDGITYLIERTLGKSSEKTRVYQADSDVEIAEISTTKQRYAEWIRTILGINENFPLDTIFDNAIGVKQGLFISPFLMAPNSRSKIFAPLLNVDIYSTIVTKYLQISNKFADKHVDMEKHQIALQTTLEQKPDLENKRSIYEKKIQINQKSLSRTEGALKTIRKTFGLIEGKKNLIDKTQQQIAKFSIKSESLIDQYKKSKKRVSDASKSKNVCTKTKPDYEKYRELGRQNKKLKETERNFRELEEKLNDLARKEDMISVKLDEVSQDIYIRKDHLVQLPKLNKIHKENEILRENHTDLKEKLATIKERKEQLMELRVKNKDYINRMDKLQSDLKKRPQLLKQTSQIEERQKSLNTQEVTLSTLHTRNKELRNNVKQAKDGICPLCEQVYKKHDGKSLDEHFREEIESNDKQIAEAKLNQISLTKTINELKQKQAELDLLNLSVVTLEELSIQYSKNQTTIEKLIDLLRPEKSVNDQLGKNIRKQKELSSAVDQFIIFSQSVKELPKKEHIKKLHEGNLANILTKKEPIVKQLKELKGVPEKIRKLQTEIEKYRKNHDQYQFHIQSMEKLPELEKESETIRTQLEKIQSAIREEEKKKIHLEKEFDNDQFEQIKTQKEEIQKDFIRLEEEQKFTSKQLQDTNKTLKKLEKDMSDLEKLNSRIEELDKISEFSKSMRTWYKVAKPKITKALMDDINISATNLYRKIKGEEAVSIEWQEDYDVHLKTGRNPLRRFIQLSGGEQMAVALAIRLAVLKTLTDVSFAFFDEPTTNLDSEKRRNLAACIQNVRGFKQIFVISHDDTFEERSDHVIRFSKNDAEETQVEFLS
ncbi:MAG: AAA family ATPase [Promethearchaeota archaeon]